MAVCRGRRDLAETSERGENEDDQGRCSQDDQGADGFPRQVMGVVCSTQPANYRPCPASGQ